MKKIIFVLFILLLLGVANRFGYINIGCHSGFWGVFNQLEDEIPELEKEGLRDIKLSAISSIKLEFIYLDATWKGHFPVRFDFSEYDKLAEYRDTRALEISLTPEGSDQLELLYYEFSDSGELETSLNVKIKNAKDVVMNLGPIVKFLFQNQQKYSSKKYSYASNKLFLRIEEKDIRKYLNQIK